MLSPLDQQRCHHLLYFSCGGSEGFIQLLADAERAMCVCLWIPFTRFHAALQHLHLYAAQRCISCRRVTQRKWKYELVARTGRKIMFYRTCIALKTTKLSSFSNYKMNVKSYNISPISRIQIHSADTKITCNKVSSSLHSHNFAQWSKLNANISKSRHLIQMPPTAYCINFHFRSWPFPLNSFKFMISNLLPTDLNYSISHLAAAASMWSKNANAIAQLDACVCAPPRVTSRHPEPSNYPSSIQRRS